MRKIILFFICIFIVGCSNEASIELSDELSAKGFEIIDVQFLEDEGVYYFTTNKKIVHEDGVSTIFYENTRNNFFDWLLSFIGIEDKSRVIDIQDFIYRHSNIHPLDEEGDRFSYIYVIDSWENLSRVGIISKIVIATNTEANKEIALPTAIPIK